MKACRQCQRLFEEDAGFCPQDGTQLCRAEDAPVPPDPADRRIGACLCGGRYQVRRKVADGGMGRVYQALDLAQQRSRALKVLHREVAADEVALERFKREFSFSAQLPHDHIVEVFDFQRTEDHSYALVMEYLEGEELRMMLKREKHLQPERIIRIVSQIALGLGEAHRRKQVHRDLKPDNVFLCGREEGATVKLLDFGSVRDNTEAAKKLTVVGTTIGSPFYMSPEQAQGLPELDHRADVWSVTAIAYECLTGRVPFVGSTGPQILLAILGQEPQPPSVSGAEYGVPATVDDVIVDGLAKVAATRIGTLAELADRFGQAYGLTGTHGEWAYTPERELRARIDHGLPQLLTLRSYSGLSQPGEAAAPPSVNFTDDDFVMGVPTGPPVGLIVGAIAVVVLVGGAVAAYLLF